MLQKWQKIAKSGYTDLSRLKRNTTFSDHFTTISTYCDIHGETFRKINIFAAILNDPLPVIFTFSVDNK